MTRTDALEHINAKPSQYLQRDGSGKGYVCPICGSGSGKNGTGLTCKQGDNHFTCWRGCFTASSVVDILALKLGREPSRMSKGDFDAVFAECGLTVDSDYQNASPHVFSLQAKPRAAAHGREPQADYTAYIDECAARIGETDYRRGISLETLRRFKIGYDPAWIHPANKAKGYNYQSPRLIIPNDAGGYLARDVRAGISPDERQYSKQKAGSGGLFNTAALHGDKPVFVTEGELDALSVIEAGAAAVGLGSVSHVGKFVAACKEAKPTQPIIIALDDDTPGRMHAEKLAAALKEADIFFLQANISGGLKDPNEFMMADREAFEAAVIAAQERAIKQMTDVNGRQAAENQSGRNEYLDKTCAARQVDAFIDEIETSTPPYPTGFDALDRELDGGLFAGLYCLGSISSLGKTTFCSQIGDQIAASGHDVLVFSLEMSRFELMAKSISRLTVELNSENDIKLHKTVQQIRNKTRWSEYNDREKDYITACIMEYKKYTNNLFIIEGVGNVTEETIQKAVEEHKEHTGNAPVVIVDYLQIIQSIEPRFTDKQVIDRAVLALKRISRDYKIPVIGISSLNRANYKNAINFEAFKESGAIEYSSDVLIGLQLKGLNEGDKDFDVNAAKSKEPREIELVILKNRNGRTGGIINYYYHAWYNYFKETGAKERFPYARRG